MVHTTMEKFGYPDTLIKEFKYWTVQLRAKQATLGALVMICKEDVTDFPNISAAAFTEMQDVTTYIETTLKFHFSYAKINYLMLMMVDPHVHFHVIPRYDSAQDFEGQNFTDPGYPTPPDLSHSNEITKENFAKLLGRLKSN